MSGTLAFSLIFALAMVALWTHRQLLDSLIEAIRNFRGGPPRPMHPSPVNDRALLFRRLSGIKDKKGFLF